MKVTGSLEQDFQVGKIRVDGKPRGRRWFHQKVKANTYKELPMLN